MGTTFYTIELDGQMDKDGLMDGWMDGEMDGWIL